MRNTILLFISIYLLFNCAEAQNIKIIRPDGVALTVYSINSKIKKLMDTAEVPGLCIGMITDNKIRFVKAYGYKNKAKQLLNDTATCFYGASLSKPLFAYLVMQLVDAGKIELDKPLYTYLPKPLPDYKEYKDLEGDEKWKLITARHCLDHTTGFPNWREFNPHDNKKLEIFFTPGERYAYSGEGLYLLQFVVETITGKKLEDLAQENIFRPFGMRRTSFVWQPSFQNDYALGHDMNTDTIEKDKRSRANAAGSMETTIADYTRFVAAVMQGKRLSKKSKDEMLAPQIGIYTSHQFPSLLNDTTTENKSIGLSYGLGWGIFKTKYGKAFFKEGHGEGWVHYMVSFPEKKYSILIMSNSANGESMFKELVEDLTGITIPWKWEGYTPYKATVKLNNDALQKYTGVYDGKLKAIVTLENGQLKVESASVNLPKTNLYASSEDNFFLKVMDTQIRFVKGKDGRVEKAILADEGENYELKKTQ